MYHHTKILNDLYYILSIVYTSVLYIVFSYFPCDCVIGLIYTIDYSRLDDLA